MPDISAIRNLADALRRSAVRRSDEPALITTGSTVTWAELDRRVDAVTAGLVGLALPGEELPTGATAPARVAIALPNEVDFAVAYLAVLRAGLIAVPTNPGYTARELRHVLGDSGTSVLIGTSAVIEAVAGVRSALPALLYRYQGLAELVRDGERVDARSGGEDWAVILYTSGTAGAPKGAMLSHRALIANHEQVAEVDPPIVRSDDTVLLSVPLFHAYGLNSGLGAVVWHGARGVLGPRFDPAETLDLIERHGVTVVAAVPQMFLAWAGVPDVAARMASVRVAVSGAAPLNAADARRFEAAAGRPLSQGYGLTETAPVLTTSLASPHPKPGSIGRPVARVEVRLIGADGTEIAQIGPDGLLRDLDDDDDDFDDDASGSPGTDPGEIVVRGPNLFGGYWPDGRDGPDEDGWWATGDIAYADAEGDLFLVDRLGELVIVSGFNVYPHEVELVLAAYPGVAEAAVVGVPDPQTGQAVKAFVVREPGAGVTEAELRAHAERNLARFKCPAGFEFLPELPHSATGKVRKTLLIGGAT